VSPKPTGGPDARSGLTLGAAGSERLDRSGKFFRRTLSSLVPTSDVEAKLDSEPARALLLIGDIGGYTRFMRLHRLSLAHAQEITGRLLKVLAETADGVRLVQFEGDAALFYVPVADGGDAALAKVAAAQSLAMHRAFHVERQRMVALSMCNCDACRGALDLTVKFVAHIGEVAVQRFKRRMNLSGVDVIAVHQLLKNAVPVREYVLMTDQVFRHSEASLRDRSHSVEQELEGLGRTQVYFVDIHELAADLPPPPNATRRGRLAMTMGVALRGMPHLLGLKRGAAATRDEL